MNHIPTIRTLLVDDEKNSREVLFKLLTIKHPNLEIVGEAATVEEAYELCVTLKPQLVFLDIQMPQANGFNLLKKWNEIPFDVIFVTSFDHYAITAIKFNALDYLLKPIDIKELDAAVEKVIKNYAAKTNENLQVINLIQSLDANASDKKIAIHSGDKVKIIKSSEVQIIQGDGRYCHLTLQSGEKLTTPKNVKDFEDYFGAKSNFIRISKSHMINASFVKNYFKGEPFIIQMINDETFEVARRKKSEVLAKVMRQI